MNRRSIAAAAAAALIALALLPSGAQAANDEPASSVQVETAPLRRETLERTVDGYGSAATGEEAVADMSFLHAGQITQLFVRPGQPVHAGDKLVELTTDPSAAMSYDRAVAALEFARRDLARTKTLVEQHMATNAQLAAAQKAVDDAAAAVETERRLGNDQRTETATAPFDGFVSAVSAAPGDRVQAGSPVLKLARDTGLRISVGIEPQEISRIKVGMPARIVPVFGVGASPIDGAVQEIDRVVNPTTKWIDVAIGLKSAAPAGFVPGVQAQASIVVDTHEGWVVPRQAVLQDDRGAYVFQAGSDGKAHRVDVTTGIETDQETEIAGPLDPASKIVTIGNYELQDGGAIREAAAAAAAGDSAPQH